MSLTTPASPIVIGVVGDSLPLPRQFQELEFYQTYPYLLADWLRKQNKPVEVWSEAQAGVTVAEVAKKYQDYRTYVGNHSQGIGILHLGIVDCTPRPVPLPIRRVIGKLPGIMRRPTVKLLHDYRVQILKHGPEFVFTRPETFRRQYQDLISQMSEDFGQVYAVNIIPPGPSFEARSPGVAQKTTMYNRIIAEVTNSAAGPILIDIWEACQHTGALETLVSSYDGHHLSLAGHHQVFQMIAADYEKRCAASPAMDRTN